MLELNASYMINLVIWFTIILLLLAVSIIGFYAIRYQQFNSAIQETLARTGGFHEGGGNPAIINNKALLNVIHKYGDMWVVEPVPNLSSYNGASLNGRAVEFIVGQKNMRKITLTDAQTRNGDHRRPISADYLYGKVEHGQSYKQLASRYNNAGSVLGIKPQYMDLSEYDADWLKSTLPTLAGRQNGVEARFKNGYVPTSPIKPTASAYYPSKVNSACNGVTWTADGQGYGFDINPWTFMVGLNNKQEPQVKYASQIAYLIVPNNDIHGNHNKNASGLTAGVAKFTYDLSHFNSRGRIQLVTNQVRSVATRGENADVQD